jgi:O-antigen/teichoic acid export membrane protein
MSEHLLALQGDSSLPAEEIPSVRATAAARQALSLRANFSWTFAGNVVYAACQWGMLMVLAKLGNPLMVGQYALGLAVTAPVIMLSNLQLRGVLATDARETHQFSTYLALRVWTTAAALVTVVVIAVIAGYQRETALVVVAVGFAKAVESMSDIAYGFQQHQEQMDRIARSMMLRGAIALGFLGLGVYATGSVLVGCVGVVAGWAAVLFAYDLRPSGASIHDVMTIRRSWRGLCSLAWIAAPLGLVMMLSSLNVNIPRYFIQHYTGERTLGLFAAVAYTMVAGTTVVGALGQSASPRLAHYYAEGQLAQFQSLMWRLLSIGALLGLSGVMVAVTCGAFILRVLFRPEYAASADVLSWMMATAAISYLASFLGYGLTAARRFKIQAPLLAIVCGSVALTSSFVVPRYGLLGAAWATLAGAAVQLVGSAAAMVHALAQRSEKSPS